MILYNSDIQKEIRKIDSRKDMPMPVIIPENLPASKILMEERIFVMHEKRAKNQDIRPLRIAIVNLMPTKIVTETQLLRLIGNTSLQVEVDLIHMDSHVSKNTSTEHLQTFYTTFEEVKNQYYDGLIVTGAPVETMDFEDVNYWNELTPILDFAQKNVFSSMFICWGAQAALYHYYGVSKHIVGEKIFGVFEHHVKKRNALVRGFDDIFYAPHSRHTTWNTKEIKAIKELEILADSEEAGVYMVSSVDQKFLFVSGHSEYDASILKEEYLRDKEKGLPIAIPKNYFPNNDITKEPLVRWRGHGNLLFANWLNRIYQDTPYDLEMGLHN